MSPPAAQERSSTPDATADLGGRYRGATLLGEGSFGLVYRAFDEVRGRDVAIKTLRALDPTHAYRLKREFRLLAELSHPNLVSLHELVVDARGAFFTAELLNGESLSTAWSALPEGERFAVLRRWLAGILGGLGHLAAHGLAHRDVKPANVRVVDGERAVLLDFGLSGRVGERGAPISGTLEYMAPEAILGAQPSIAGDLYALGTVLFELLHGRLPFPGDARAIVERKCTGARPHAPDLPGTPEDLRELALACVSPDPASRPSIEACLDRLGVPAPAIELTPPFFGRAEELEALERAFHGVGERGARVVVEGPSGIGKSELLRRFCRWAASQPESLVLVGRCIAREHVRFKALDEVVDQLADFLIAHPDRGSRPADLEALDRIFPVLSRVAWPRSEPRHGHLTLAGLQQRADRAFGELVASVARGRRLVVWIDDLQWSDADSRGLLETLAALTEHVPLLLVTSHRSGSSGVPALEIPPALTLRVGPLARADALRVITAGRGPLSAEHEALVDEIVDEIGGDPHLLAELRASLVEPAREAPEDLQAILTSRLHGLSDEERRLLVLSSLADVRLSATALGRAAGMERSAYDAADRLVRRRILRREPSDTREVFEPFHDRIRDAALAGVDAGARRTLHERLGESLVEEDADPSLIASHFAAAERFDRAAAPATRAADTAFEGLAFDRAAHFYGIALVTASLPSERARLLRARGNALAWSGRASEGSRELLSASELLSGADALDALSTAAELLIGAGQREPGLALLRRALAQVGIPIAMRPWRRVLDAVVQRAALSTISLERTPPARPADGALELEIALAWRASLVLTIYDPMAALDLQARHTRRAFRAGDAGSIARGRAMEIVLLGSMQKKTALVERLEALVRGVRAEMPPSTVRADIDLLLGLADAYRGRLPAALRQLDAAAEDYGEGKISRWQLAYTRAHRCLVLELLGEYASLAERTEELGDELARGDDRLGRAFLDVGAGYVVDLMEDSPESAIRRVDSALSPFAADLPVALQWLELRARVKTALYGGEPEAAVSLLERARRVLRALFRFQNVRIEHARLCAAAAIAGSDRPSAARALAVLERERDGWAPGMPALIRGRLTEGEPALDALRSAEHLFEGASMSGFAAAARMYADRSAPEAFASFARPERWLRTFGG